MTPDKIDGLLFIDCWHDFSPCWYDIAISNIQRYTNLKSIIVASYGTLSEVTSDKIVGRTLELYRNVPDIVSSVVSNSFNQNQAPHTTTDQRILNVYANDDMAVALYDVPSFLYHTINTNIKNWLVIGGKWQVCTQ